MIPTVMSASPRAQDTPPDRTTPAMTDPSRTSVGAAIATGLALLAALVGFSMLGGSSTEAEETRAAAAASEAAELSRASAVGCRRFTAATMAAGVDATVKQIRVSGVAGDEYFYEFLASYGPAIAAVAEVELLPDEQFDVYIRLVAITRSLQRGVQGSAPYESVVSSASALEGALSDAREVCASAA